MRQKIDLLRDEIEATVKERNRIHARMCSAIEEYIAISNLRIREIALAEIRVLKSKKAALDNTIELLTNKLRYIDA